MKGLKYTVPAVMMFILTLLFFSCSEENNPFSLNGTWHVEENSQLYGTQHYDARITQLDSTNIEISNFYNLGVDTYVQATLDESTLTISKQDVSGYIIQGSGSIKSDFKRITFNFTASDGTVQDVVVAQFKR